MFFLITVISGSLGGVFNIFIQKSLCLLKCHHIDVTNYEQQIMILYKKTYVLIYDDCFREKIDLNILCMTIYVCIK